MGLPKFLLKKFWILYIVSVYDTDKVQYVFIQLDRLRIVLDYGFDLFLSFSFGIRLD